MASTHKSDRGSQCLPLEPKMATVITPAPRAPIGGALLPGSANREKSTYGGPARLFMSLFRHHPPPNNSGLPISL